MEEGILIYVAVKHMGNLRKSVKPQPFFLQKKPKTFGGLIEEAVKTCLADYNERAKKAKSPAPLTDAQWEEMRELGKFAFGVHYNENGADEAKATETALGAVRDGLVRVFRGNEELTALEDEIEITEGEVFTFVKLAMLSGRMW